jgi:hypothetical protein
VERDTGRQRALRTHSRRAKADRRITDQALWVPTANIHVPELVSSRLRNYQFHPVWDFIADQAWLR